MKDLKRTIFYNHHVALGARMVGFAGWDMPVYYPTGILEEHVATRKRAGLFDISHMGRFLIRGADALPFLQYVLTSNAQDLHGAEKRAQYAFIPNERGGAVDDVFLYLLNSDEYLIVVNASNKEKDWEHLRRFTGKFSRLEMDDRSEEIGMLALQGPFSSEILREVATGPLPAPVRNAVSKIRIGDVEVTAARTGYTGSPVGFEFFFERKAGPALWNLMVSKGAVPVGLAARDTLRLEAGLPLYGHELGTDLEGKEIPIFACPLARFGVSFSPLKGDFVGRSQLKRQDGAFGKLRSGEHSLPGDLPRRIRPVAVLGRGIARQGDKLYRGDKRVGYITSGTSVPIWDAQRGDPVTESSVQRRTRAIGLAYLDSDIIGGERITIEVRGKRVEAVVVDRHMKTDGSIMRPLLTVS